MVDLHSAFSPIGVTGDQPDQLIEVQKVPWIGGGQALTWSRRLGVFRIFLYWCRKFSHGPVMISFLLFFVGKVSPLDSLIVIHPFLVRNFLDYLITITNIHQPQPMDSWAAWYPRDPQTLLSTSKSRYMTIMVQSATRCCHCGPPSAVAMTLGLLDAIQLKGLFDDDEEIFLQGWNHLLLRPCLGHGTWIWQPITYQHEKWWDLCKMDPNYIKLGYQFHDGIYMSNMTTLVVYLQSHLRA